MFSLIISAFHPDPARRITPAEAETIKAFVQPVRGLVRAHLMTPEESEVIDPTFDEPPSPMVCLQLYFERLETLEAATAATGALQALARAEISSLSGARMEHQAMWTRPYPTPSTRNRPLAGLDAPCSYFVHYPGYAEDLNPWLTYYLAHHPQVMYDYPTIREIEVFTRVDWTSALPWERVNHMQRNKLMFDSAATLQQAVYHPVREAMRADRAHFPPFEGGNIHFPLSTDTFVGPLLVPMARDWPARRRAREVRFTRPPSRPVCAGAFQMSGRAALTAQASIGSISAEDATSAAAAPASRNAPARSGVLAPPTPTISRSSASARTSAAASQTARRAGWNRAPP